MNLGFGTGPVEGLAGYVGALLALAMKGQGLAWAFAGHSGVAEGIDKIPYKYCSSVGVEAYSDVS